MKTYISTLFILTVLTGCSSLKPQNFSSGAPILNPVKFFSGHTHSTGVMEARNGKPSGRITTQTTGLYTNQILNIEQNVYKENGNQNHRSFNLKLVDEHHIESTGSDIIGHANGELYGNYFVWSYRLKIANKGLIKTANMTQYMLLMPDGKTLIVRSIIRKFGIKVLQITEQFSKDD